MKITRLRTLVSLVFSMILSLNFEAQVNGLELDPVKEKMFSPYMLWRHQGVEGLQEFKKNHPHDYLKELWYYSESFYVKRDYFADGVTLDVAGIDISRLDAGRKEDQEEIVVLAGFRDVLVLLPANKLLYNPRK